MTRWIQRLAILVLGVSCASQGAVEAPDEDEYYALFMQEVLARSMRWLGDLPRPTDYCVAIAPGSSEPDLGAGREPSPDLLAKLNASSVND